MRTIHLGTGGRPRCGHPAAACLTADDAAVDCARCLRCMRADSAPATIHLGAGGRARCGHPRARTLTADDAAVDCGACLLRMTGRINRQRRLNGIEDYLFIGGDRMPAAKAAERLGVTARTVQRYRAELRRAA